MLQRILVVLSQAGWQIESLSQGFWEVRDPAGGKSLALYALADGQELPSLGNMEIDRLKDVLVICSGGVNSDMLKQVDRVYQYWFWDLQTGQIFPYPFADPVPLLSWLDGVLQGEVISFDLARKQKTKTVPWVTYVLILVDILIFLLMEFAGGATRTTVLIAFGAKVNPLIDQGEVWRLLVANFLHIGFVHLAFNMYALWSLGAFVEELFGHARFLLLYLVSGIGGTSVSYLLSPAISAGASGAIFGLLGALIVYSWKRPQLWRSGLGMNLIVVTGVNLVFGMIQPGIDNFAHLGGLLSGAIVTQLSQLRAK